MPRIKKYNNTSLHIYDINIFFDLSLYIVTYIPHTPVWAIRGINIPASGD